MYLINFIIIININSQINIVDESFITLQFSLKDKDYRDIILNNVIYILNTVINLLSVDIIISKKVQLNTVINELL